MGERKGVNKYYPPDYDPSKGSLNAYHGTHALRERARKIDEGIIIIRFEMPYNIWCNGCGNHIGMGVRYNAQKRKMGNYYTTPIYKFRMKCHLCEQHFEIQTDPKNCDYTILSGCRRKEERWDTEAAGNVQTTHREVKEKMMRNAMYKLEHGEEDIEKGKKFAPNLSLLEEQRDNWYNDFQLNSLVRRKFRTEKKEIAEKKTNDDDLKRRANLNPKLNLLDEQEEDMEKSKRIRYGSDFRLSHDVRKRKRRAIKQSSIFGKSADVKIELAKNLIKSRKNSDKTSHKGNILLGIVKKKSPSERTIQFKNTELSSVLSSDVTNRISDSLVEQKSSKRSISHTEISNSRKNNFSEHKEKCNPKNTDDLTNVSQTNENVSTSTTDILIKRDSTLEKDTITEKFTKSNSELGSFLVQYNNSSSSESEGNTS